MAFNGPYDGSWCSGLSILLSCSRWFDFLVFPGHQWKVLVLGLWVEALFSVASRVLELNSKAPVWN